MPSLQKDPRGKSPFWYAAYRTPSGKRIYRSTKTTDRRKALEIALNLERAEREATEGRLTESRVRELLNDIMERKLGRRIQQTTTRVWFTKWLADKEADGNLSGTSRVAYAATIRLFLEHLGKRADDDLTQAQVDDVERFKHRRIASGLSAKTIDRDLKVLRAILKRFADACGLWVVATALGRRVWIGCRRTRRPSPVATDNCKTL